MKESEMKKKMCPHFSIALGRLFECMGSDCAQFEFITESQKETTDNGSMPDGDGWKILHKNRRQNIDRTITEIVTWGRYVPTDEGFCNLSTKDLYCCNE